ncbi:MAG: Ppx/GppA family phosphatase [Candidatus Eisenbacteria bacterium]|uniref:Ppx/GppA family phosphatase n=1 Tax=Eiseniibacteriota bacterium TaxID=2212470 RepID=A0A849SRT4_UNCEI|nr:Ppx/GppA family phosphatase [Candidatus Eisenbacteria bacterium]
MRIAAIDIGTNSIHMVIADATSVGSFVVVEREREVVQIGRGSFRGAGLRRDAMQRTVEALARFTQLARRHGADRILCTATAAVREARNGGEFLQAARAASGVQPRVIPAEVEGRLIYLGVKSALQLGDGPALVVDIGGGSAQLVVGDRERLLLATSAPLGALRLSERFLDSDPPSRGDVQRLRRHIREAARDSIKRVGALEPSRAYGSSGSIHALAQIAHWLEHGAAIEHMNGHVLTLEALSELTRRLSRMTLAQRERLPGIDARRAEIIVPGALVLLHVLEATGMNGITVSDFGVREGLVTDYIEKHRDEISRLAPIEDLRLRSVLALLDRFQSDAPHARHVAMLALALFDALATEHRLDAGVRDLLHYAALLHDVGSAVGFDRHAEHSAYIIRNGNLRGLSSAEVDLVALVARYHSKAAPRKRDPEFAALPRASRRTVRWLAGMLRVAEGLDRSHYQLIRGVRVSRRGDRAALLVAARRDAKLELWAARGRTELLARMLGSRKRPMRMIVKLDPVAARAPEAGTRRAEAVAKSSEASPPLKIVSRG